MITERELSDAIYAGFSALDGPAASDGPQRIAERLLEGERGMIGRANNNDYAGASTTFDPTDATQAPLTTTSIVTADSSAGAENPLQDLSDAARNIITELEKLGFTHQPPINLHDLLARFNLDLTSARFMLQSIASRYPQGLGLDFLG